MLKCRNKETGDVVAIKKFKEGEDDEIVKKTTLREVKVLRMLKQANIVSLREAFRRKGKLYLVFEYVERNLLEILEECPNGLPKDLVRRYVFQLVLAIEWCHRHDVIHRDIKPENLLINPDTHELKLCDFGFARTLTHAGQALTDYVATRWCGLWRMLCNSRCAPAALMRRSPLRRYRAPELLLGTQHYNFAVDIWAIACIMGELIDSEPVFPGESEIDQLYIIQRIIGPLTSDQHEMFLRNPRFVGLKFPDMTRPETLQKKYLGKLSKRAVSFMRACLQMNPKGRLLGEQCIAHTYFDGIREDYMTETFDEIDNSRSRGARPPSSSRRCVALTSAPHGHDSLTRANADMVAQGNPRATPIAPRDLVPRWARQRLAAAISAAVGSVLELA